MKCKRRLSITRYAVPAGDAVAVNLSADTVELLIRVVDPAAANAPQAFGVAVVGAESAVWHLAAGEAWRDDDMQLGAPLGLVVSAAQGTVVEVARWEG